jgi:hypothetical protein
MLYEHIRRVHVVFKTHLDIGFTDLAENVVHDYYNYFIPKALRVSEILKTSERPERFIWTTGSWLIHYYLERANVAERKRLEKAILEGDIVWNAMPFTPHSEFMGASLFRYGLSLSQTLDKRFGKTTVAAKTTDVPGNTRAILPLLAEAGVQLLDVGVNSACTQPEVPSVFIWCSPEGSEVITLYHDFYGGLTVLPNVDEALALEFTRDNLGPHTPEAVIARFHELKQIFPNATVEASTLDCFAHALQPHKDKLPVVTKEIGDTWVHGVASDPTKVSQFRELLRLRETWLKNDLLHEDTLEFHRLSEALSLVAEHTWGLSTLVHLGDRTHYHKHEFHQARLRANLQAMETSWQEQRDYLQQALTALTTPSLRQVAEQQLVAIEPTAPTMDGVALEHHQKISLSEFTLEFNDNGAISYLEHGPTQKIWSDVTHPLALFSYEVFSAEDYRRFFNTYITPAYRDAWWLEADFGKPGLNALELNHQYWQPELQKIILRKTDQTEQLLLSLTLPTEAHTIFGAPKEIFLTLAAPKEGSWLDLEVQWFNKPACRIPEAAWLSFTPKVAHPETWSLDKLGQMVHPLEVVPGGGTMHAVERGIRYNAQDGDCWLESLDAPLVAPGEKNLLCFDRQPRLENGMHFNLYNNVWGTNYPQWFGEAARFRYRFSLSQAAYSPLSQRSF